MNAREAALRDFGDHRVPEATKGALLALRRIHSEQVR